MPPHAMRTTNTNRIAAHHSLKPLRAPVVGGRSRATKKNTKTPPPSPSKNLPIGAMSGWYQLGRMVTASRGSQIRILQPAPASRAQVPPGPPERNKKRSIARHCGVAAALQSQYLPLTH